jgi:hypothetical protein
MLYRTKNLARNYTEVGRLYGSRSYSQPDAGSHFFHCRSLSGSRRLLANYSVCRSRSRDPGRTCSASGLAKASAQCWA